MCSWILVEFLGGLCMLSHPHRAVFNMAPCRAFEEKQLRHNQTDKVNQCKSRKQNAPQTDLWHP